MEVGADADAEAEAVDAWAKVEADVAAEAAAEAVVRAAAETAAADSRAQLAVKTAREWLRAQGAVPPTPRFSVPEHPGAHTEIPFIHAHGRPAAALRPALYAWPGSSCGGSPSRARRPPAAGQRGSARSGRGGSSASTGGVCVVDSAGLHGLPRASPLGIGRLGQPLYRPRRGPRRRGLVAGRRARWRRHLAPCWPLSAPGERRRGHGGKRASADPRGGADASRA